ncbi:MAG: 3-hydroxyacyl-CoA dehydrogenase NAD-binding domain-containing protein [Acidimicrobiia bacterium]|nr:3-hydroxyacyl-CoA dehydrogenase NAD-binding domain-containing protein [Acidimicrobiia bacterium]
MADPASPDAASLDGPMAVIGCGVIGSGWVARLALCGLGVRWFDPAPAAGDRLGVVRSRARRAWQALGIAAANDEGPVVRVGSIGDAVQGAAVVFECLPERLDVKRAAYVDVEADALPAALIASSTSGIRPTDLQAELIAPERLVVAHPFNPVYLLPLVEVVAGAKTSAASVETATAFLRQLGMHPLHVRVEVDAFIADRLLEAVWREALWLINDGVATTEEVDDAIRFGFGLRWAHMGLFETYRVAGGDGGIAHFLGHFGESLTWPWSRLTDTPELTAELIATIAAQSDAQTGDRTIADLEEARDTNLVALLAALAANDAAAGRVISEQRRRVGG